MTRAPSIQVAGAGLATMLLALLAAAANRRRARVRSDRVFYAPAAPAGGPGRPARHGAPLKLAEPASWPACQAAATDLVIAGN